MKFRGRRGSLASMVVGATCILSTALWAGGAGFGDDDDNSEDEGPAYFGFVKDTKGEVAAIRSMKAGTFMSDSVTSSLMRFLQRDVFRSLERIDEPIR